MKEIEEYFFCYSIHMFYFLRYVKGFKFITHAKRIDNDKEFFLFERTPFLNEAINEYHNEIKGQKTLEDLQKLRKE